MLPRARAGIRCRARFGEGPAPRSAGSLSLPIVPHGTGMTGATRWLRRSRAAVVTLLLGGGYLVVSPGSSVPAASVQSLQAQAQAIEAELTSLGSSVHAIALSIQRTRATVAADEASEAMLRAQLARERATIAHERAVLVTAADQQFVTAGQYSTVLATLRSSYTSVGLEQGYEQIASSSITQALATYDAAVLTAQVAQAELAARIRNTSAELAAEQQEQAQLQAKVQQAESTLASVHSQIQQALQAAAAAPLPAPGGAGAAVKVLLSAPPTAVAASGPATPAQLLALRECESGNNYQSDTGNGYYGAYQFALSTWLALGFSGLPSQAPPSVQDQAAEELLARAGWGQWPVCSALIGF
jgi:hypothetical protein